MTYSERTPYRKETHMSDAHVPVAKELINAIVKIVEGPDNTPTELLPEFFKALSRFIPNFTGRTEFSHDKDFTNVHMSYKK